LWQASNVCGYFLHIPNHANAVAFWAIFLRQPILAARHIFLLWRENRWIININHYHAATAQARQRFSQRTHYEMLVPHISALSGLVRSVSHLSYALIFANRIIGLYIYF
jgi:hypothetical protein